MNRKQVTAKAQVAQLGKTTRMVSEEYLANFVKSAGVTEEYTRQLLRDNRITVRKNGTFSNGKIRIVSRGIPASDYNIADAYNQPKDIKVDVIASSGFNSSYPMRGLSKINADYLQPFVPFGTEKEVSLKSVIKV